MAQSDTLHHGDGKKVHPFAFSVILLVLLVVVCWLLWYEVKVTFGGEEYKINMIIWIIPGLLAFTIFSLLFDALIGKGMWLNLLGRVFSIGYFTFGESLMSLKEWYDNPQEAKKKYEGPPKDLERRHAFAQWMVGDITAHYENNVQAMAYWGAAILIFLIGLRGIKIIPKNEPTLILVALWLELTLLFLLGMVIFYKPEEKKHTDESETRKELEKTKADLEETKTGLKTLGKSVEDFQNNFTQNFEKEFTNTLRKLKVDVGRLK